MKIGFQDEIFQEKNTLLDTRLLQNTCSDQNRNVPGSFSTVLRNFQFLNLVSVFVNVSTNHEDQETPTRGQEESSIEGAKPHTLQTRIASSEKNQQNAGSRISGGFSTLLRNFQIFNLVSVLVNVSTNLEDEQKQQYPGKYKSKAPNYYDDIFGRGNEEESRATVVNGSQSPIPRKKGPGPKIPILFRLESSDRIETFTVSTSYTYTNITPEILELVRSSPNCTSEMSKEGNIASKIVEIEVDWDIGDGRDWPKRTRLTEKNCEGVLLLMERGMMGVLEVPLSGRGGTKEEDVDS